MTVLPGPDLENFIRGFMKQFLRSLIVTLLAAFLSPFGSSMASNMRSGKHTSTSGCELSFGSPTSLSFGFTGLGGSSHAARSTAASTLPNDRWFNGSAGYGRAVELQRELKVPIVVYFYADWCGYCRTLDSQYLPSAPVQEYLRGVVKVRINPEHGRPERALADRYGIKGYPSFFVIPYPGTRSPVSVSPFRRVGTLTPTQFANACRSVAPVSRKMSAARNSGANGELRDRASETVTKQTTTFGGTQIVTVVPATPVWTRRRSRTRQP